MLFLETNYCKNEIIRKQKHSNGKTKHKTIDRTLQKPTTYILQQRSVVKMYFIIMINLEIKKKTNNLSAYWEKPVVKSITPTL